MEIIDTQNHSKLINTRNGKNVEFLRINLLVPELFNFSTPVDKM
jgi:hypothetical protein